VARAGASGWVLRPFIASPLAGIPEAMGMSDWVPGSVPGSSLYEKLASDEAPGTGCVRDRLVVGRVVAKVVGNIVAVPGCSGICASGCPANVVERGVVPRAEASGCVDSAPWTSALDVGTNCVVDSNGATEDVGTLAKAVVAGTNPPAKAVVVGTTPVAAKAVVVGTNPPAKAVVAGTTPVAA